MATTSVLEQVEALATERWGKGAAVSVNEEDGKHVVRCWDRRGFEVASMSRKTRDSAIKAMRSDLQLCRALAPAEVDDG